MIKTDQHMHTNASTDCPADLEDIIKHAISIGLSEICITDHVDFPLADDIRNWNMIPGAGVSSLLEWATILDDGQTCELCRVPFDTYIANYKNLAEAYSADIDVRLGCELGLSRHCRDRLHAHLERYPFDFVIGSQHSIDCWDICANREAMFSGKTKREAYTELLTEMTRNVRDYDCFDVLGHTDYIIRYVNYDDRTMHVHEFDDLLTVLFQTLIGKGMGIELNTSGLRYGLGQAHPNIGILRRYRELGGEIVTVGSDAHRHYDVGKYLHEAAEILLGAGFKAYCTFKQRKPTFITL